ncbi:AL5AP protein, partial [Polypterus senegalus]
MNGLEECSDTSLLKAFEGLQPDYVITLNLVELKFGAEGHTLDGGLIYNQSQLCENVPFGGGGCKLVDQSQLLPTVDNVSGPPESCTGFLKQKQEKEMGNQNSKQELHPVCYNSDQEKAVMKSHNFKEVDLTKTDYKNAQSGTFPSVSTPFTLLELNQNRNPRSPHPVSPDSGTCQNDSSSSVANSIKSTVTASSQLSLNSSLPKLFKTKDHRASMNNADMFRGFKSKGLGKSKEAVKKKMLFHGNQTSVLSSPIDNGKDISPKPTHLKSKLHNDTDSLRYKLLKKLKAKKQKLRSLDRLLNSTQTVDEGKNKLNGQQANYSNPDEQFNSSNLIQQVTFTDANSVYTDGSYAAIDSNLNYEELLADLLAADASVFFAHKVELECKTQTSRSFMRTGSPSFERVYCANTPGYIFGKRIISFLFFMSVIGILNNVFIDYVGSDFRAYVQTLTKAFSALPMVAMCAQELSDLLKNFFILRRPIQLSLDPLLGYQREERLYFLNRPRNSHFS